MTAAHKPAIEVVRVSDTHADALAVFFRAAWGDESNAAEIRRARAEAARANPVEPGADIPAIAYLHDGSVLGYLSTIPARFWNGTLEVSGHWLKGFMVLPEHRGGPVGFAVLKEMLKHVTLSGMMTVAEPARRLFAAVGYKDCGILPNYITFLRPERVARHIDVAALGLGLPGWIDRGAHLAQQTGLAWAGGMAVGAALSGWRVARSGAHQHAIATDGLLPDAASVDDLWQRSRLGFTAAAVRDHAMLSWRYAPAPGATYEAVNVRDSGGRLVALSIVRRPKGESDPRLRGIKVATVSDLLFAVDDAAAGLAALIGAEEVARRMDADAILCSTTTPAIASLLPMRAYVRLPGNVHLMIRDPKEAAGLVTKADAWWITRGDAGSDEVF